MFSKISLIVGLAVLPTMASAQGSMAPEVRVVITRPSPSIIQYGQDRVILKSLEKARKAESKSFAESEKFQQKMYELEVKEYYKRLAKQKENFYKKKKK